MASKRLARTILCLVLAILAGACSSLRHGGAPDPMYSVSSDLESLKTQFKEAASIEAFYSGDKSAESRNRFLDGRIALANLAYIQFVSEFTSDKQLLDTATDMLTLGLNLFGTITTGVRAQTNLAASAAGIGGTKAIVDKNYYFEKTVPALIATMNAKRKEILTRIIEGSRQPVSDYTFTQAVADTHEYYAAGTLNGAIMTIQGEAAAKETRLDNELRMIGELQAVTEEEKDDRAAVSRAILDAIRKGDLRRMQNALKLLGLSGLPQSTAEDAAQSLRANFRDALRRSPGLASQLKGKL